MIGRMGTASRFDPSSFPDSPYAAELQRDPANLRFSPRLEREYTRAQLMDERSLIRVVAVIARASGRSEARSWASASRGPRPCWSISPWSLWVGLPGADRLEPLFRPLLSPLGAGHRSGAQCHHGGPRCRGGRARADRDADGPAADAHRAVLLLWLPFPYGGVHRSGDRSFLRQLRALFPSADASSRSAPSSSCSRPRQPAPWRPGTSTESRGPTSWRST